MKHENSQDVPENPEPCDEQAWPTAPLLSKDLVPATNLVATLAVDIWSKGNMKDRPRDHLREALELVQQAELLVQRPLTENEFLLQTGGGIDALTQVMLRRDNATPRRIRFERLVDPDGGRHSEMIEITDREGQRIQIDWSVYKGKEAERSLKKLLLKFSAFRIQEFLTKEAPQLVDWVTGGIVSPRFPDLTEGRFDSTKKRTAEVEPWINGESSWPFPRFTNDHVSKSLREAFVKPWIDGTAVPKGFPPLTKEAWFQRRVEAASSWGFSIEWTSPNALTLLDARLQSNWKKVVGQWKEEGIPEIDFIELARYRRKLHSGAFATKPAKAKGKAKTAKAKQPS